MARDVFISYSRKDKDIVQPFVHFINDAMGRKDCCWIDLKGIESGDEFEDVIMQAIDKSQVVLFMLSESSLKSPWTKREVYYAESEGKRIVPVLVDGDKLRGWFKFHFGNVDYISIQSEEHKTKLVENLHSWLNLKDLCIAEPEENRQKELVICTIVSEHLAIPLENVKKLMSTPFVEYLDKKGNSCCDELDFQELLMTFEEEFGVEIPIEKTNMSMSINDIIHLFSSNKITKHEAKEKDNRITEEERITEMKICSIVGEHLKLPLSEVKKRTNVPFIEYRTKDNSTICDELDFQELLMAFEEEFDIDISTEEENHLTKISDVVHYILSHERKILNPDKRNKKRILKATCSSISSRWGFEDELGNLIIPYQWKSVGEFREGLAIVMDDNEKFGFIDKTGNLIIPCQWGYAESFSEGSAKVEDENGKWWIIDKTGKIIGETTR